MRVLDRKSLPWSIGCLLAFVIATVAFFFYARATPRGPHGGSWPGLAYGISGSALIIVAMLLSLRKRMRRHRVGRTQQWMQAHVWLGTLAYPLIIYHAGWSWGGTLTQVLMWLFTAIVISGIIGLALQQVVPARMSREVPSETVFAQIDHVIERLRTDAETLLRTAGRERANKAIEVQGECIASDGGAVATVDAEWSEGRRLLQSFYEEEISPLLDANASRRLRTSAAVRSDAEFARIRNQLPDDLQPTLSALKAITDERRQLSTQRRLHRLLHGWLLFHVPISYAMVLLAIAHAVWALRYASIGR